MDLTIKNCKSQTADTLVCLANTVDLFQIVIPMGSQEFFETAGREAAFKSPQGQWIH